MYNFCHLKVTSFFRCCDNLLVFVLLSLKNYFRFSLLWQFAAICAAVTAVIGDDPDFRSRVTLILSRTTCWGMEDANYHLHWFFLLRFVARVPVRVRLPGGGIIKISQKLEIDNSFCDQQRPGDRTFQQPGSLGCCWLNKYQPTTEDKEQTLVILGVKKRILIKDQSHALE